MLRCPFAGCYRAERLYQRRVTSQEAEWPRQSWGRRARDDADPSYANIHIIRLSIRYTLPGLWLVTDPRKPSHPIKINPARQVATGAARVCGSSTHELEDSQPPELSALHIPDSIEVSLFPESCPSQQHLFRLLASRDPTSSEVNSLCAGYRQVAVAVIVAVAKLLELHPGLEQPPTTTFLHAQFRRIALSLPRTACQSK